MATAPSRTRPDPALDRVDGDDHRHGPGPETGCGPEPAQAQGPGVQAHGDGGQQRHRPAEEHGEKSREMAPRTYRLGPDKPQALQRLVEAASGGGYPVLEHVVHLVVADRTGGASGRLARRRERAAG